MATEPAALDDPREAVSDWPWSQLDRFGNRPACGQNDGTVRIWPAAVEELS